MVTIAQYTTHVQDIASAGTTAIFTGPIGYNTTISGITFNSQTPNNITVFINRITPASTVIAYAFTLAAGDVISDNNTYILAPGDTLQITTTSAATHYMFSASSATITTSITVYL